MADVTDSAKPKTVDEYISALEPDRQLTADAMRDAVMAADSEITASIKYGQVVFELSGPVAALKAHSKHVTLTFWRGAALSDPTNTLEGDGDRMRHVRYLSAAEVDANALQQLVTEAADMNRRLGNPTKNRTNK
jgi:hypothetical protein